MEKEQKFIIKVRGIILNEGKMLCVKHPHDLSFACLPGGHLEFGENIKVCLSRELFEELGVVPNVGRLLYINSYLGENQNHYLEFIFEILNGVDYLNIKDLSPSHAFEIAETIWVDANDEIKILPEGIDKDFKNGNLISSEIRYVS